MRTIQRIIYSIALLTSLSVALFAQDPTKDAPEVKKGVLPNKLSYYTIPNPDIKGIAHYALIQKDNQNITLSRQSLTSLPHFGDRVPSDFLRDHGISCGPEGYISYDEGSTLFELRNVDSKNEAVCDSTLLLLFDLASYYDGPQAIIICGDIDQSSLIKKIQILSLILPTRNVQSSSNYYSWDNSDLSYGYYPEEEESSEARFKFSYTLPRLEADKMSSMQAIVAKQYASYFGSILTRRIRHIFRCENIALSSIDFVYNDSASGPDDESLEIEISTSPKHYSTAIKHISSILAEMDSVGVSARELQNAKDELVFSSLREAGLPHTNNSILVRKCCAAFLYGAPISSDYTVAKFFSNSRLSNDKELIYFNNYISALLDAKQNLTLSFDPRFSAARMPEVFAEGWESMRIDTLHKTSLGDTLSLYKPQRKIKLRSSKADRTSGGSLWTFSNGMQVVYKKSSAKGVFNYAMMIRGGSSAIEGLSRGENAYIADMLSISNIAGMSGEDFKDLLLANGISMQTNVSCSEMTIKGCAPSEKLSLLLRSLLSVANMRKSDHGAFDYYTSCSPFGGVTPRDQITTTLDSLLAPSWKYPEHKWDIELNQELYNKSYIYFDEQFSRCSDGVLVLIGDLEQEDLKRILCENLGDFRTSRKAKVLPNLHKNCIVGQNSFSETRGTSDAGVNVALSMPFEYKLSEHILCRLAETALYESLISEMAKIGAHVQVQGKLELYPETRYTIYITCAPCPTTGLPLGVESPSSLRILESLQHAINMLTDSEIDKGHVSSFKSRLSSRIQTELNNDSSLVDATVIRYATGKEVIRDFDKALSSINAAMLQQRIKELSQGGRVDYIIL